MTIKKAVDHFIFKFNKVWKTTPTDIESLKTIMKFVEEKHKKQIQDYHLFAKLYIMVYAQFLEKYKTTIFDDVPAKELSKYLNYPIDIIIERFTDKLNESELYSLFDELNIKMSHPALKNESEKKQETDVLEKALKIPENFEKFTGQIWSNELVKENLILQINNTINQHH